MTHNFRFAGLFQAFTLQGSGHLEISRFKMVYSVLLVFLENLSNFGCSLLRYFFGQNRVLLLYQVSQKTELPPLPLHILDFAQYFVKYKIHKCRPTYVFCIFNTFVKSISESILKYFLYLYFVFKCILPSTAHTITHM